MALTVDVFLARFCPEFVPTNTEQPDLVAQAVADANEEIGDAAWGGKAARGQALHAACALARSPFGMRSALVDKTGVPIYQEELDRLRVLVGLRNRAEL